MFLGDEPRRFGVARPRAARRRAAPDPRAARRRLPAATQLVSTLSLGERQLVEIARALTTNARIIVMDEPTTSLTARETERLFEVIAGCKAEGIAHHLHQPPHGGDLRSSPTASACCATAPMSARSSAPSSRPSTPGVDDGRPRPLVLLQEGAHALQRPTAAVVLSVRGIGDGRRVHDCSFDLHAGEVLGIAGLVGSGRTELARLIFGADPQDRPATSRSTASRSTSRSPRDALDAGIAYLTEDRKALGLFLDMSISDNINIGVIGARRPSRRRSRTSPRARERADAAIKALSIRTAGTRHQRRRALGRQPAEGAARPPARDQAARRSSSTSRRAASTSARSPRSTASSTSSRSAASAIVVISSELPEIIGIADRVLVMREGRIVGEVAATPGSADRPGRHHGARRPAAVRSAG